MLILPRYYITCCRVLQFTITLPFHTSITLYQWQTGTTLDIAQSKILLFTCIRCLNSVSWWSFIFLFMQSTQVFTHTKMFSRQWGILQYAVLCRKLHTCASKSQISCVSKSVHCGYIWNKVENVYPSLPTCQPDSIICHSNKIYASCVLHNYFWVWNVRFLPNLFCFLISCCHFMVSCPFMFLQF